MISVYRHQAADLPPLLSETKMEPASPDNGMYSPKIFMHFSNSWTWLSVTMHTPAIHGKGGAV